MRHLPLRSALVGATTAALAMMGVTGTLAADLPSADGQHVIEDPGPDGDFFWKGFNWERRTSSSNWGPAYNKRYEAANVVGPDANGHVTLKVTNGSGSSPVSAEFSTTRRGFGYGTYTTVVAKRLDVMQPELVWGCLFTYDAMNAPGYTEIDVCEASAWGGGVARDWPVMQTHGYWFDAAKAPGVGSVAESFPAGPEKVLTHRMTWEPQRLTIETLSGEGLSGPLLKRTILTGTSVPIPTKERLHFNFWVFGGNGGSPDHVKAETVVIRDFTFTPAGVPAEPVPAPGPTPTTVPGRPVVGDWNGDGRSTPGLFREGRWALTNALSSGADKVVTYGRKGDIPIVGDWNGDGRDTFGIVRDGTWHLKNSLSGGTSDRSFTYGRVTRGDVPIVGNWNGTGGDGVGIIRDGTWHLRQTPSSGKGQISFTYGRIVKGDLPLVGDWNGNGRDSIGIVRDGTWHLRNTLTGGPGQISFTYGRVSRGDVPVVGDWNTNGRAGVGVVRGTMWHLRYTLSGGSADRSFSF